MRSEEAKAKVITILDREEDRYTRKPTTSCVTGYSPASVTGASRSRSYTAISVVTFRLDESELPLMLPEVESYMPTDNGESPLAAMTDWVEHHLPVLRRSGKA